MRTPTTKTMKKTRTTTKNSLTRVVAMAAAAVLFSTAAAAQKRKPAAEPYAIVGGQVFREPGFALPEAKITIALKDAGLKAKKLETMSSPRGEFTFHVPPSPAVYVVRVSCKGYIAQEKEAQVNGEERVEVTFVLAPESK